MIGRVALAFTAIWAVTFLPCITEAQDLAPTFQLSAEETAKAKRLTQELQTAHERFAKARSAWQAFHQGYQASHAELRNLRFTSDFRLAVAFPEASAENPDVLRVIELTAEEQRKLGALNRELVESGKSEQRARRDWEDYRNQLVADHVASNEQHGGAIVTLSNGHQVAVPYPWSNGIAFTPDFRFAVTHY